jgi:hypothetical protein
MRWFEKSEVIGADSDDERISALEARVAALEARVAQLTDSPLSAAGGQHRAAAAGNEDDTGAWLQQVADLAASGDRAGAIGVYRESMGPDEQEAAAFVDGLIADPPRHADK